MIGEQRAGSSSGERRLTRKELERDDAPGIYVCPGVDLAADNLFRRHVSRCPDRDARLRESVLGSRPRGCCGGIDRLADAEVGDDRGAAGKQDVLGLDVAVDDAVGV
jgi:hypothetical protein